MEYTSVTNVKYANANGDAVDCIVTSVEFGEIPFTASPNDVEAYGREIYSKAINGDFGTIADFVAHVPTAEEIRAAFIADRTAQVKALTVTTVSGKTFNGDEVSQSRMARAILAAGIVDQTQTYWTLANNVSTLITLDELKEALGKSMQAMAAIWVQE